MKMRHCSKVVAFSVLATSVAFAAMLKFEPFKMIEHLQSDVQDILNLVMKPHTLSRYIPTKVYEEMGLDPSTRLLAYKWDNCGNKTKENLLIQNITFTPDPIQFPGMFSVSFKLAIKEVVESELKAVVKLYKKVATSWIKIPCIANIGSCTYNDICTFLNSIGECPPAFVSAHVPCKCPFQKVFSPTVGLFRLLAADPTHDLIGAGNIFTRWLTIKGVHPSSRLMSYDWDNCWNETEEKLIIQDIQFKPDPLVFPGTFSVSFDIFTKVNLTYDMKVLVKLSKKVASSWIQLPCMDMIGSCTYGDVCTYLDQSHYCPPEFKKANIPCQCPYKNVSDLPRFFIGNCVYMIRQERAPKSFFLRLSKTLTR